MPVVIEDCRNFFETLTSRFPLLENATADDVERLDGPRGITTAFRVRSLQIMQPLVFVFFPHDDEAWLQVARDTFDFEGECWRKWGGAVRGMPEENAPFRRHYPPPIWTGLEEQHDEAGISLIGRHDATLSHLDRRTFPILVRPYIPWTTLDVAGSLTPMKGDIEKVVNAVVPDEVRRPIGLALADLDGSHLLGSDQHLVPTRWRIFHRTFFGLGLSRPERARRTPPPPPLPEPRPRRLRFR